MPLVAICHSCTPSFTIGIWHLPLTIPGLVLYGGQFADQVTKNPFGRFITICREKQGRMCLNSSPLFMRSIILLNIIFMKSTAKNFCHTTRFLSQYFFTSLL